MTEHLLYAVYFLPLAAVYAAYLRQKAQKQRFNREIQLENEEAGVEPPPTLHPIIDPNRCIGCEACVHACPEFPASQVLGVISGKASLVSPSDCIGHGACQSACPVNAITLVFGSATRGVDIPNVSPRFETSVRGIFVAGELGGMGLIRNAVEQGRQAMAEVIRRRRSPGQKEALDVMIVGAGPAGLSATLVAHQHKLRYVTVEQNTLGGTVAAFPRGKIVTTAPTHLAMVGQVNFRETRKETLLKFWRQVEKKTGIRVRYRERVDKVTPRKRGFVVQTNRKRYQVDNVVLAIGRRGTPRKLGVPGEDLPKVTYSLADPASLAGKRVLVVGGGDSALEAACALAEEPGTRVTLSYRSEAFNRAKRHNRQRLEELAQLRRVRVLTRSSVTDITATSVTLEVGGRTKTVRNDHVLVCAGGVLPTGFLKDIGIEVERKYGTV